MNSFRHRRIGAAIALFCSMAVSGPIGERPGTPLGSISASLPPVMPVQGQPAPMASANLFSRLPFGVKILMGTMALSGVGAVLNLLKPVQRVGVVTIEGTMTESGKTVKELQAFFKNPLIKAIVLKINSGGGAPGASQAIYQAVRELKKVYKKPVIAWVENVAASGAYYAACSADVIVAAPSAMVGSVGVIAQVWQLKSLMKKFDVGHEILTSGAYKASGNQFNEMTPEQRAMHKELLDSVYQRFIADVRQGRPQLAERPVEEWADGRIFDADRGLKLGMVDRIGSQITIEQVVKELTKDPREIELVFPVAAPSFLRSMGNKQELAVSAVDAAFDRLEQRLGEAAQVRMQLIG